MGKIKNIYITASKYLMILSFPMAAGGIVLAKPIINILFGPEYSSAILLMQIIFIPFAMRGLTHAVSSVIYGVKEPVFLLRIGVILVVLSLGLNYWLIPKYGTIGAVIGTSIPRIIALPLYIRFVSKKIGAPWPLRETAKIVLASALMGILVFAVQYFLNDILGLISGIVVGIILYIVFLLKFHLINKQDLHNIGQIENRLPVFFRKYYSATIRFFGRYIKE